MENLRFKELCTNNWKEFLWNVLSKMMTEFSDEFIKLQHMVPKRIILGKRISTLFFLVPSNVCVEWSHTDNICASKNTMMTKFAKEVTWSKSEQWVELSASHIRIQQMKQKESSWEMAGHGRSTSWQLSLVKPSRFAEKVPFVGFSQM